jgi:hypothetical protein
MSAKVYELAAYREDPHLVFPTIDGNVHVLPVELIDRWISGEVKLDIAQDEILLRSIIRDWKVRALHLPHPEKK